MSVARRTMTNLRRSRAAAVAPTVAALASMMCLQYRNVDAFCVSSLVSRPSQAAPVDVGPHQRQRQIICPTSSSVLSMCICINCSRVTSCQGYHFVETQHEQPHMDENPQFDPQNGSPTIHVHYRSAVPTERAESEFDRMVREHRSEEKRAEEKRSENGDAGPACEVDAETGQPLHGEERYDLSPVTTVEYDVVDCADYVEDMGAWVRNMPEEIRRANPSFVPT